MNYWIDSHCHLEMIEKSPCEIVTENKAAGVTECITIGTDHPSNIQVVELTKKEASIWGTLGIHPHEAKSATDEHFFFIEQELKNNQNIIALGECGYDFFYTHSPQDIQREVFIKQLGIAQKLQMPVVLHTREAEDITIETLKPFLNSGIKFLFHSFTSNNHLADFGIEHNFYFSFNGISTFPKSDSVREILKRVPLNRIILETDSPYLAPKPHRGRTNLPAYVHLIGEYLANYLNIPIEEFAKITRDNTLKFFSKIAHEN